MDSKYTALHVKEMNNNKIDSLQALRALAFLGIFFGHAHFFVSWAGLGVSIFYVMSGFLLMYKYGETALSTSARDNLAFSLKRIKKLYPLHIITMLFAVCLSFVVMLYKGITIKSIAILIGEVILNITLLQTWFPNSNINVSLNGVAWYLSVTMFLYFVFPYLHKTIKRITIFKLCLMCGAVIVVQILTCIPLVSLLGNDNLFYIWFMYCFPVFRLGDFFIGCTLGRIIQKYNDNIISKCKASVCEVLATLATILILIWMKKDTSRIVLLALKNRTTLYIPLAVIWVFLFTINKGFISNFFTNKLFIYIGNMSSYAFLIHFVVTQYTDRLLGFLELVPTGYERTMIALVELFISVLLTIAYKHFHEKYFVNWLNAKNK